MIDSFYDIKPLEDWLKEESGLICQNENAFVTLNTVPSAFGHSLVIPKRKVYKATDLTPQEIWNLQKAKETGLEQLHFLINENPDRILRQYQLWIEDAAMNARLPCRDRISGVTPDLDQGPFYGQANIFENQGQDAGQMIRHYHIQIVPRFRQELGGGGAAFFEYLHK
ncbi:MAG: HIT domain-containing protein [Nanoarchaeota archaeon]